MIFHLVNWKGHFFYWMNYHWMNRHILALLKSGLRTQFENTEIHCSQNGQFWLAMKNAVSLRFHELQIVHLQKYAQLFIKWKSKKKWNEWSVQFFISLLDKLHYLSEDEECAKYVLRQPAEATTSSIPRLCTYHHCSNLSPSPYNMTFKSKWMLFARARFLRALSN